MVKYVMNLILAVGSNMKWTTKLNRCLMPLKKILEIKYTYGSLKQPTEFFLVEGKIFFIYHIMGDIDRLFIAKVR